MDTARHVAVDHVHRVEIFQSSQHVPCRSPIGLLRDRFVGRIPTFFEQGTPFTVLQDQVQGVMSWIIDDLIERHQVPMFQMFSDRGLRAYSVSESQAVEMSSMNLFGPWAT